MRDGAAHANNSSSSGSAKDDDGGMRKISGGGGRMAADDGRCSAACLRFGYTWWFPPSQGMGGKGIR